MEDLDNRFLGNKNAMALHYASDVAIACIVQCLSQEDYIEYAKREPFVRQNLTEKDLRNIWRKTLEMGIL